MAAVAAWLAAGIGSVVAWSLLDERAAERTGLTRRVYVGADLDATLLREDVTSDLTLGFLDEDPSLPRRSFSVRWQGFWYAPRAQTINVFGAGDDRLDVWLDGEHLIRRRPPADMHMVQREVAVEAGPHALLVTYSQDGGDYAMRVAWEPIGGRRRAFAPHRLFRERPGPADIRLARQVHWLGWLVPLIWTLPPAAGLLLLAHRRRAALRALCRAPAVVRLSHAGLRAALLAAVAAVIARALFARLPGWNPGSLWYDDLVYAAVVRTQDFWGMVTAPLHVAPGLLVAWRTLYALFPDPEWSLQLLSFACGIAAIPVMAWVVRVLTRDDGLAVLAAGVTALNQLLAHYTVFVHQFAIEFVITALFLLAAVRLSSNPADPRRFGRVALSGGLALFISVPSVFISFPLVNLAAACAARDWFRDRRRAITMLGMGAAYNATVLVAWLLLRNRSNPLQRAHFADGFMPLGSPAEALGFLAENGRRLLETSLPGWVSGWQLNPGTVSWPLPFLALGLAWLLARPATRFLGLVVTGFYAARIVASALWIFPLGMDRTDVFAFPLAIALFAAGIQAATAALPEPRRFRLAAAAIVVAFALARPVDVRYFETDDVPLVDHMAARIDERDAVVLSESAIFLTAFYGPWAVATTAADNASYGVAVSLVRDSTLHLTRSGSQGRTVGQFVHASRPERVWYVAHNTQGWEGDVVEAIRDRGYAVRQVQSTTNGRLYRGERRTPH